ncbi:hypothetical protein HOC35_03465 [Candidatus Woesearchaeota archaeon]|jgi:hypothetical protein|nr:hypothetical protein [Candidatus Woesearchaeota archaeon]
MDILKQLQKSPERGIALYEIDSTDGSIDERVKRYIASTPETRRVCTQSDLIDYIHQDFFSDVLKDGIKRIMLSDTMASMLEETWGDRRKEDGTRNYIDQYTILRGALNFDISKVIFNLGYRAKQQMRMAQREDTNGNGKEWVVYGSGEKKIFEKEEPEHVRNIHMVIGDISASGASIRDGLEKFVERMEEKHAEFRDEHNNHDAKYTIGSITLTTIGCINTEREVQKFVAENQQYFTDDFVFNLLYLEGRFGLADLDGTSIPNQKPGTDFLPGVGEGVLISPEFEKHWLSNPIYPLEKCIIYDGGGKRCDPQVALENVQDHFQKLQQLSSENGETLYEALKKRCPYLMSNDIDEWRATHPGWQDKEAIPDSVVQEVINAKNSMLDKHLNTHKELMNIYKERIAYLQRLK